LAHVVVSPPVPPAAHDVMWEKSKKDRLQSLGGVDDERAKARVAFTIPLALAQSLGCLP
jgi:hypothetical protein